MRTLPTTMVQVLAPFVPLFSERVWAHVQLLVAGAILAPARRTVALPPSERWACKKSGASAATIGS